MNRRYVMGARRARMNARLDRLLAMAPTIPAPISRALNDAFVRQYEREVHLAYQRRLRAAEMPEIQNFLHGLRPLPSALSALLGLEITE